MRLLLFCFSLLVIPINDEFLNDPVIRAYLADVVEKGGYGRFQTEQAAFLVRDEEGGYRCAMWPSRRDYHQTQFDGLIPDRTVAIIHTHPRELPTGSNGDRQTAQRLGVPIFVLTPRNIYLVTADGESVAVVKNERWTVSASSSTRCTAAGSRPIRARR